MPGCGRRPGPLAPYWGAVEADTVRVLPPGPRSLLGPAEDKGHAAMDGAQPGGQEVRRAGVAAQSTTLTGPPRTKLDPFQLPVLPPEPDRPPTGISSEGLGPQACCSARAPVPSEPSAQ